MIASDCTKSEPKATLCQLSKAQSMFDLTRANVSTMPPCRWRQDLFGKGQLRTQDHAVQVDCTKSEPNVTQCQLRKAHSMFNLTRSNVGTIPPSRWRRHLFGKGQEQACDQHIPFELAGSVERSPVEDVKQRWRGKQIAIQQKLATPEKVSFWSVLTGNRCCQTRTSTADQLRSIFTKPRMGSTWLKSG